MKGTITCQLCQRDIAEHRRGELCWLNELESGLVRPRVANWPIHLAVGPATPEGVGGAT